MKKALIMYHHGVGDVIQLMPQLRFLFNKGYKTDLMCCYDIASSHLVDDCPYVGELIVIKNPWRVDISYMDQINKNTQILNQKAYDYDYIGAVLHLNINGPKVEHNSKELRLQVKDLELEVFISPEIEDEAMKYIEENYPNGYIFNHTLIEWHPGHNWDSLEWIKENLPELPIIDTGQYGNHKEVHENINFSFVLAREANHRVLSSSVFVHACDAMNVQMDVVNYGTPDRKVWPLDQSKVLKIRENGVWLR